VRRRSHRVSRRGFGAFVIRPERESRVIRFDPAQRLRARFGRSSTSRGARRRGARRHGGIVAGMKEADRHRATFAERYPNVARWVRGYG
jgi:hypothetical protein